MTFYNQMVPGNRDDVESVAVPPRSDVEIEWHGGPREQGGYATARPVDGKMSDHETDQAEMHEAHRGPVSTVSQGLRTITVAGVQLTVDPTVFDDFELLESLAEIQRGDILALPTVFRAVTGDQAPALLNSIRRGDGRVTATAATELLVQIMSELAPKA